MFNELTITTEPQSTARNVNVFMEDMNEKSFESLTH